MTFFNDAEIDSNIETSDVVAGGYQPLDSDVYPFIIQEAYGVTSSRGAKGVALKFKHAEKSGTVQTTVYVTRSQENGGGYTFTADDGSKRYLPGYDLANGLALVVAGKHLKDLTTETRVIKQRDSKTNQDINKEVPMFTDLVGQPVYACVKRVLVDKRVKQGNQYVATGETREENEYAKFLRASDKLTYIEIARQATEPTFYKEWLAAWKGRVHNRAKGAPANGAKPAGSANANNGAASGLFGQV